MTESLAPLGFLGRPPACRSLQKGFGLSMLWAASGSLGLVCSPPRETSRQHLPQRSAKRRKTGRPRSSRFLVSQRAQASSSRCHSHIPPLSHSTAASDHTRTDTLCHISQLLDEISAQQVQEANCQLSESSGLQKPSVEGMAADSGHANTGHVRECTAIGPSCKGDSSTRLSRPFEMPTSKRRLRVALWTHKRGDRMSGHSIEGLTN